MTTTTRAAAASTTAGGTRLGPFTAMFLPASFLGKGVDFLTQEVRRLQEEELPSEDDAEATGVNAAGGMLVDFPPTVISFETPQPSVAGARTVSSTIQEDEDESESESSSCSSMGEEGDFLCLDDSLSVMDAASILERAETVAQTSSRTSSYQNQPELPPGTGSSSNWSYQSMQLLLRKQQSLLRHPHPHPSSSALVTATRDLARQQQQQRHQQPLHHSSTSISINTIEQEGRVPTQTYLHTLSGTVLNPNAPPVARTTSQHMGFVKNLRKEEEEADQHVLSQQQRYN
uniref:Uncharacterized protein n=1 Tax=Grammatophora oceanica TaxID=210454 RepID=A0A7S1Y197_9STRA|mmetsp:Transcript_14366/g.21059  ORF Transcript_14366/g.21059 Transcript_14366/m.21059 type:complete len:288 (+) Transcript_14366:133-996(+)